jgi:ureidoacrylate peracid hydrolase
VHHGITRLDPAWAALLIVDMQNAFIKPEGSVSRRLNTEPCRKIVPAVVRLRAFCKQLQIPVIFTKQEHHPQDAETIKKLHKLASAAKLGTHLYNRMNLKQPALYGSWDSEFIDELKPLPDEYIVVKNKFSAFYCTNLETLLRSLNRTVLLVTGVNTNTCVESTVRDAYQRDIDVIVLDDCVAAPAEVYDLHLASLKNVERYFGWVMSSEELINALKAV